MIDVDIDTIKQEASDAERCGVEKYCVWSAFQCWCKIFQSNVMMHEVLFNACVEIFQSNGTHNFQSAVNRSVDYSIGGADFNQR